MKFRTLLLVLSLVASACVNSTATQPQFGEPTGRSTEPPERSPTSAQNPVAAREEAFGLYHQDRVQFQVRSTTHGPNSTTLEIFTVNSGRIHWLNKGLEFALRVDGQQPVKSPFLEPLYMENYETLWVEFPVATTVNSELLLEVKMGEEPGELTIYRSAPELPRQIDPLTEPIPFGVQVFGPSTFELRSVTFGPSSITADLFAANQTAHPMGIWADSRAIDDLGNEYSMMLNPSGEYFSADAKSGALVSAAFAGRIHPEATELTVIIDHATKPVAIGSFDLDMPQKLVPPLPLEGQFEGQLNTRHGDLAISGGAVSFSQDWTEVELEIINSGERDQAFLLSIDIWLADDLGNEHRMMIPKRDGEDDYLIDPLTTVNGVFRFAGGVSPDAKRLRLVANHAIGGDQVVAEIALERVGPPTKPDPVSIRRFSRYRTVLFGESVTTSELLDALETQVDAGVVELELPDDVLFEFAKSDLSAEGAAVLADVAELLARSSDSTVLIAGHTDGIGTVAANLLLSQDRAETVRRELVDVHNIDSGRLTVQGLGEGQPIAEEFDDTGADSPEGRARNRRTEIRIDGFDG